MKDFLFALTTLCSITELGLIFYMFSSHYANNMGIVVLIGLFLSIIVFLLYLLQEKQDEIERSRRKPRLHSIQQPFNYE